MHEDIRRGIDEQIIVETSVLVHARQLKLLWISYTNALNWPNGAELAIDVSLHQGSLNGGRLSTIPISCKIILLKGPFTAMNMFQVRIALAVIRPLLKPNGSPVSFEMTPLESGFRRLSLPTLDGRRSARIQVC